MQVFRRSYPLRSLQGSSQPFQQYTALFDTCIVHSIQSIFSLTGFWEFFGYTSQVYISLPCKLERLDAVTSPRRSVQELRIKRVYLRDFISKLSYAAYCYPMQGSVIVLKWRATCIKRGFTCAMTLRWFSFSKWYKPPRSLIFKTAHL